MAERVSVKIENRQLSLSNLDKVLYPVTGFTKGEVIDYYTRIAPVLLPHLADRPLTIKRYPNGVDKPFFFEKNAARGTPDWVRTESLPVPGSTMNRERIDFIVVEELATLVWLANLAALELHVPQWRLPKRGKRAAYGPHRVRPRPGTAGRHHPVLRGCPVAPGHSHRRGLDPVAKTSGNKGLQVSAAVSVRDPERTSAYAQAVARTLEQAHPKLVVSRMAKTLRAAQGVRRLEPEQPGQDDGIALLAARSRTPDGVDATWLGRGRALDPPCPSPPATCSIVSRTTAICSRRPSTTPPEACSRSERLPVSRLQTDRSGTTNGGPSG